MERDEVPSVLRSVARVVIDVRARRYDLAMQIGRWHMRPIRGGDNGLAVTFAQSGAEVAIEVFAAGEVHPGDVDEAVARARGIAGLDDDPSGFDRLALAHPLVAELHRRYPGVRLTRSPTVWEMYARAVIEQLVTGLEAKETRRRIWRRYGDPVGKSDLMAPPLPAVVARVAPWELRPLGLSLKRAVPLVEGARHAAFLESLRSMTPEIAMAKIQHLRGVGKWTANVVAMRALGHADAVLVGDSGAPFVTTMALTGKRGGDDEMIACLEPFRPHRARVHRLLEIASFHGGLPGVPPYRLPRIDPHRRFPWRY
jgi:3-methyladenine DNA glycosylase/8-oxoguanine DNA glycosylase